MSDSVDVSMSCPVCLETMSPPITQCQKGHSVCGSCLKSNSIRSCPLCRSPMTEVRNFQLENLIDDLKGMRLKAPCAFASRGCKFELKLDEKEAHQQECHHRVFRCEGKTFCGWDCNWMGNYSEILQHFRASHASWMEFKTEGSMKISFDKDSANMQVIDYFNGQELFWYKHKVDVESKKVYWVIQYVGLKTQAANYYYEFEIYSGAIRKQKVTEVCENDARDVNDIFKSEKCVALSFKTVQSFLNDQEELRFRFRLMKIKKERTASGSDPVVDQNAVTVRRSAQNVNIVHNRAAPQHLPNNCTFPASLIPANIPRTALPFFTVGLPQRAAAAAPVKKSTNRSTPKKKK